MSLSCMCDSLKRLRFGIVILLAIIFLNGSSVLAVLVPTGNGNTTAPLDDPGFANVGRSHTNGGSVVYLGNRWIITANHVTQNDTSFPNVNLGGSTYTVQTGTVQQLTHINPSTLLVENTDLKVMRLTADPGLPSVSISNTTPTVGSQVTMIGNGLGHPSGPPIPNQLYWEVTGPNFPAPPLTWTQVAMTDPNNASGFMSNGPRAIRWGENLIDNSAFGNVGSANAFYFDTVFDNLTYTGVAGLLNEAQAVTGDSGGGVFYKDGSNWLLAGIMVSIGTFPQQPASHSVFGNDTNIIDLSHYRSQILSIIPEPSSMVLGWLAAMGFLIMARRQQR